MSDSVQPQRWQPTKLPRPWDSPGKNTGVGCHFLLQCMKVKSESEVAQLCPTLSNPMDRSLPGSSAHGIFQARVLEWGAIAFSRELIRSIAFSRELIRSPKMSQLKITQVNHLLVLHIRAPTQTTGSAPEVGRMHSSPASPRGRPTPSPLPPSGGHLLAWVHGALSASAQPAGSVESSL